jgi:hypothetical protein
MTILPISDQLSISEILFISDQLSHTSSIYVPTVFMISLYDIKIGDL